MEREALVWINYCYDDYNVSANEKKKKTIMYLYQYEIRKDL